MPYIADAHRREQLANRLTPPRNAGELAFLIALDVDDYFTSNEVSFAKLSDTIAALESVKSEIQRRFMGPYEARKHEENGDVFFLLKDRMPK